MAQATLRSPPLSLSVIMAWSAIASSVSAQSEASTHHPHQKQRQAQEPMSCGYDFSCYNGAQCTDGPPAFDDHFLPDGTVLEIHQVDELMVRHCACPPEWTGIECTIPVANCEGVDHYCYNGGKCIDGLQDTHDAHQLFCDCSLAFNAAGDHFGTFIFVWSLINLAPYVL